MSGTGVYAYGVIRDGVPLPEDCRGVGAPPAGIRLIPAGRIAAVVSDAPADLRARRRDLLAHQDLLVALAARGPLVPMRFGMVSADEETLMTDIADSEAETVALLERLAGRCEMNVKFATVEDGLASLLRENEHLRRLRDQARAKPGYEASLRLGEAVSAGLTRRATDAAEQSVHLLAPLAVEKTEGPASAECVRNTSFLVEQDQLAAFRAAVERLAARNRQQTELRLTGPLPCYSFAEAAPARAGV